MKDLSSRDVTGRIASCITVTTSCITIHFSRESSLITARQSPPVYRKPHPGYSPDGASFSFRIPCWHPKGHQHKNSYISAVCEKGLCLINIRESHVVIGVSLVYFTDQLKGDP